MTQNENRPRPSHAAPGVRQNLEYPVIPLYQFLDDAVSSFPDAPAAIFAGSVQTYRELGSQANRLASALRELGVQRGQGFSNAAQLYK